MKYQIYMSILIDMTYKNRPIGQEIVEQKLNSYGTVTIIPKSGCFANNLNMLFVYIWEVIIQACRQ